MGLFKSNSIISKVGGIDVEFFSLSYPVIFALKAAAGPIAKVVSSFFSSAKNYRARYQEDSKDAAGNPVRIVQEQAMTPEMAQAKEAQAAKLAHESVEALLGDENRFLIGRILMDSMRGVCKRKPTPADIDEFMDDKDLGQVVEMVQGVARANAEVLGPLVKGWATKLLAQLPGQGSPASPTSDSNAVSEQGVRPGPRLVPKE